MALQPLDVIWIHDDLIRPPGPKMVVCLSPQHGLFARVNTKGWRPGSVRIERKTHPFLDREDSHIECGAVFELDDYAIEQSVERGRGVIGRVSLDLVPALVAAVQESSTLSDDDKAAIVASLGLR